VTSNKGGVGKTTLATNLAVYIRALREDLPILVVGLDDQTMIDRMFALEPPGPGPNVATALRSGRFDTAIRLGEYGIHYVPSSSRICELKQELQDPFHLQRVLLRSGWQGLVIVDTKSDLEILTRNAIAASDRSIVVVQDQTSLIEAEKVFALLHELALPRERARILLALVDLRVKFRGEGAPDVLAHLVSQIRSRGYPLFETFVSRSPKIESLYTNPEGRALSILHGAGSSLVHRQMRHLADDVLRLLGPDRRAEDTVAPAVRVFLKGLTPEAVLSMPTNPLEIGRFPFLIGRESETVQNDLVIRDAAPWQVSRCHAVLFEQEGRVGLSDRGSRLGSGVEGTKLGGAKGERGPIFFPSDGGILVLGRWDSPFRFAVVVEKGRRVGDPEEDRNSKIRFREVR
jgi:cellulose biosynthesis protein BcsQ